MKLWIFSDIHQEFNLTVHGRHPATRFDPEKMAPEQFDAIVIAGDTHVPLESSIAWIHDHFAGERIIVVAGNHDYYRRFSDDAWTIEDILDRAKAQAADCGIDFLENATAELGGVRIIAGTLWTDFVSVGAAPVGDKIRRAAKGMTDYRQIYRRGATGEPKVRRLRPEDTIERHADTRSFIEQELAKPFSGKNIVVTHHAPHPLSLDTRFGGDLDWCFASDLTPIFQTAQAPSLWVHGHVHKSNDYRVGMTRIVSNPRGYRFLGSVEEGRGFIPNLVIDTDNL